MTIRFASLTAALITTSMWGQVAPLPSAPERPPIDLVARQDAVLAKPGEQLAGAPSAGSVVTITRSQAENLALRNNPRITADRLLALASGEVVRENQSANLPQIGGAITADKAEDGSRIGAAPMSMTDSRLYTHAGTGGSLSQLITDFGRTHDLIAASRLQKEAQDKSALATEQDVLMKTDEAFYRLMDAQSLLDVARATVNARTDVQSLTGALTKSALKSDLDLNIASADLSQSQLMELDAENNVESASAALAALLAGPSEQMYRAVDESVAAPPSPPDGGAYAAIDQDALRARPDLQAIRLNQDAIHKLTQAEERQYLPTISAMAIGGITPVAPGDNFVPHWYAAGGVNLSVPLFTGFRIGAQVAESRYREKATEKQAEALAEAVSRDVRVAMLHARTAYRRIAVADTFKEQTAQALSLAQTRYKLGLSSIVELSTAQLQGTQAAVAAVNARYDYLLSLRALDYARGVLQP